MRKLFSFVALLALIGCTTVPTFVSHDIPNLRQVKPGVYRGGQPTSPAGWAYLRSLGLTNDVKLNLEKEGSDAGAKAVGMTVYYFPIDTWHQTFAKPSPVLMSNIVAHITPGTYFHCLHGEDRTGLAAGCERVWVEGWPKWVAYEEMTTNGFHKSLHGLYDFWEDDVQ